MTPRRDTVHPGRPGRDRVICITLSEVEWQAFVACQPEPVSWLRERIEDEVRRAEITESSTGN